MDWELSCRLDDMDEEELKLLVKDKTKSGKMLVYTKEFQYKEDLKSSDKTFNLNRLFKIARKNKKKNNQKIIKTIDVVMSEVREQRIKDTRLCLEGYHKAGVVVISSDLKILLIHTKIEGEGKVHLPKGHAELPDSKIIENAYRELKEETQLYLRNRTNDPKSLVLKVVESDVLFFIEENINEGRVNLKYQNLPEVNGLIWLSLNDILHMQHPRVEFTRPIRGKNETFEISEHVHRLVHQHIRRNNNDLFETIDVVPINTFRHVRERY